MRSSWILHHFFLCNRTVLWNSSHYTKYAALCALHAEGLGDSAVTLIIKTWTRVCVCNASHVHFAGLDSVDSWKQSSSIKALLYGDWHLDRTRPRLSVSVSTDFICVSAAFFPVSGLRLAVVSHRCTAVWALLMPTITNDGGEPRAAPLLSFPVPFLSTYAIWQ